jgi:hypothetical protein
MILHLITERDSAMSREEERRKENFSAAFFKYQRLVITFTTENEKEREGKRRKDAQVKINSNQSRPAASAGEIP